MLHIKTDFLLGSVKVDTNTLVLILNVFKGKNIANNLHDGNVNLAAMFLMLPNLKIDLKTTCKWCKEVAFRTNRREK